MAQRLQIWSDIVVERQEPHEPRLRALAITRRTRRGRMSVALATAAIMYLPIAPQPHVHRAGIEGRAAAVAHSHLIDVRSDLAVRSRRAGDQQSMAPPHGSHASAVFVPTALDRATGPSSTAVLAPVVQILTWDATALNSTTVLLRAPAINGPPRSAWLTRGPPVPGS